MTVVVWVPNMSLSSFFNQKDVREKLKQEFPTPPMSNNHQLLAPPLTKNSQYVGTAFDYLLRFELKRLNPQAHEQPWIAQAALRRLRKLGFNQLYDQAYLIITQAKENYAEFLKTQQITDELIKSTLLLAQLDPVYRRRNVNNIFQPIAGEDIWDLKKLISLVDFHPFTSDGVILLNPTFGWASALVGGADADLVTDDFLIDIKTVKKLKLERDDFNQLIGYYALSRLAGIDGAPPNHSIKRLGIYFSRYAYLYVINVDDVIDQSQFPQFLEWFQLRAQSSGRI